MAFSTHRLSQLPVFPLEHLQPLLLVLCSRYIEFPTVSDILPPVAITRQQVFIELQLAPEILIQIEHPLPLHKYLLTPHPSNLTLVGENIFGLRSLFFLLLFYKIL